MILGIESSCDETAAAVVDRGTEVKSSLLHSQIERHRQFGGVVPEIAAREHLRVIDSIVQKSLKVAQVELRELSGIAITQGPGLIGALLVGISYAKGLAASSGLPLIPVNHVHAHIHGALLGLEEGAVSYPFIAAVVSGGHTHLYKVTTPTTFKLLGFSIDDACGECFDKVAKLFDLGYPGGPEIEKTASSGDPYAVDMPEAMIQKADLRLSYSGLKTHMLNLKNRSQMSPDKSINLADLMASFQRAALGQVVRKLQGALRLHPDVKNIVIAGGVAANKAFRQMCTEQLDAYSFFPKLAYCSDNGAMIAALGHYQHLAKAPMKKCWEAYSQYPYQV